MSPTTGLYNSKSMDLEQKIDELKRRDQSAEAGGGFGDDADRSHVGSRLFPPRACPARDDVP